MVYELITYFAIQSFLKIANTSGKIVLRLFTTFVVVAAILASPKRRVFIWSYCSSILEFTGMCTKTVLPFQKIHPKRNGKQLFVENYRWKWK